MTFLNFFSFNSGLSDLKLLAGNLNDNLDAFFKRLKIRDSEQDLLILGVASRILRDEPVRYKGALLKEIPFTFRFVNEECSKLSESMETLRQAVLSAATKRSLKTPKKNFVSETGAPLRLIRFGLVHSKLIALAGSEMEVFVSKGKDASDEEVLLTMPIILSLRLLNQETPFREDCLPQIFRDASTLRADDLNRIRSDIQELSEEEFQELEKAIYESQKPKNEPLNRIYTALNQIGYAISRGSCAKTMNYILRIAANQSVSKSTS